MPETPEQKTESQTEISRRAIPRLHEVASSYVAIYDEIFGKRVPFDITRGDEVMPLAFVTKQREHLRSIEVLLAADQDRDALMISRSMLEAMACLHWAFDKRSALKDQTQRWLNYQFIVEWRRILKNEQEGIAADPRLKDVATELLSKLSDRYYRPDIREAQAVAKKFEILYELPTDPWADKWNTVPARQMFEVLEGGIELYEAAYGKGSDWIHSGPESIFDAVDVAEWGIKGFRGRDDRVVAQALVIACLSFGMTLRLVNWRFALGHDERLNELSKMLQAIVSI